MEFTSTVLFQDNFIYYNVITRDGQTFVARLLDSKIVTSPSPPTEITLKWTGQNWVSAANEDLLYFLSFDIKERQALNVSSSMG
jgi:hypothetical protein